MWKATVEPDAILAYFTSTGDDLVIVDPYKLTEFGSYDWHENNSADHDGD